MAHLLQQGQTHDLARLGRGVGVRLGDGLGDDDVGAALYEGGGDAGREQERGVGVGAALGELVLPA